MKLQHLPVLSAVFCAAFFSPATAQTTATWTLAGNGNWSTGANWSTNPNAPINGQPAPEDLYNAVLDTANRTITVDVPVVVQNFTQTTGTITGASTLTINGLTTFSGGTISGAGVINALGGMSLSGGIKTITGTGRQVNHGDGVNPSLATLTGGVLSIQGVAAFSNKLGATIDVSVDGTVIDNIQGSLSTFTNEGIITKSDGAGASTIQGNLTFNNTGTVNVNSGTLVMTLGPATHTDSAFNVASGATLRFGGNTHTFGGTTALSALGTGAVQFSAGTCNFNAGSYTVGGSTIVSGGTANLNIPATTHALVVSSGTFGGTGAVTVNGTATWSGGTMSGAGATTLLGGMSLEGGNKSIRTGRQVNHGNGTNPSLATLTAGVLDIGGAGEFNNKAATTFDVSIDGTIIDNTQGSFSSFNNAGTFTKSAGAGTSTIQGNIAFNNSGVVNVNSGTLALSVTGAHSGAFNISSGASLVASNFHTLNSGTVFTGAGTTSLTGSSRFTVNSPVTMSGPLSINLSNSGDTAINGSATLTINGLMTWTRGALNTLGVTQANGGVNFTGSDPKNISANRTLNLAGNSTWTNGNINIGGGGVLANQSGGIFETNFDGSVTNTFGSLATFNNEGIFTKSAGTATTAIAITFNNTGTVNVNSGTLRFGTGGTHTGGAFNIGAGATLDFNGGTHDITAGASVSGAGTLQISSGTVTVNGDYTHTGAILANGGTGTILVDNENVASVTVSGGTLSLVTGTLASPSVVLSSGNLGGSATVNASSFTWSGGGLRGSTQLNVATTLDLTAVAVKQLPNANGSSAVLTNNGTATFGGGNLQISSTGAGLAGQFVNNGTFNATDNADIIFGNFGGGGAPAFTNAGTFNKSGAGTTTHVDGGVFFHNSGTVNVDQGTFDLRGGGTSAGDFLVDAGATLIFSGGTNVLTADSSLVGTGLVRFTGGSTTSSGEVDLATATIDTAGIFAVNGVAEIGSLSFGSDSPVLAGGDLLGSGTVNVSGDIFVRDADVGGGVHLISDGTLTLGGGNFLGIGTNATPSTLTNNGTIEFNAGGAQKRIRIGNANGGSSKLVNNEIFNASGPTLIDLGGFGGSNNPRFENSGTFNRTGTGTTTMDGSTLFDNTGIVNTSGGTLSLGNVVQHSTILLTGGTWNVTDGATLTFAGGSNIQTNQANVMLDGVGSTFSRFTTALNNNQGSLTLKNDRDLSSAGALANSGSLRVEDSATLLTVNGAYTQTAGSTTLVGNAAISTTGGFNLQGGTLAGNGTVNGNLVSNNSPVIAPGASAGTLTVNGAANLSSGTTTLAMEIGGVDPGAGHDQLLVTGGLDLGTGSTLSLTLIDDFIPTFGVNFTLVEPGSDITGTFANVANGGRLFVAGGEHSFQVHYGTGSPFGADKVVLSDFSDTIAPVLTLPDDIVMEATAPQTPVNFIVSANDAIQGAVTAIASPPSGSTFPVGGPAIVNVTASDVGDNVANDSFTITIIDTTDPVFTVFPTDFTSVEATGPGGAVVNYTVTATDIADPAVALTFSHASGSTFPLGTTVVTVTATDDSSNQTIDTFSVTVVDTTPPDLVNVPADLTVEATSAAGSEVDFVPAISSTDLVDLVQVPGVTAPEGVVVDETGGSFPIGSTLVSVQRTDAAGNLASSTFTVTVEDTTGPSITAPTEPFIAEATGPDGALVDFSAQISATDLVDPAPGLVAVPASGSLFPLGDTVVTLTATDSFDNESETTFIVRVRDTTAPTLNLPDIIAEATSFTATNIIHTATAGDIVDGDLTGSIVFDPAGLSFGFGETTVDASVTDAAGNNASGSFTVTIVDTTLPVFDAAPAREDLAVFTTSVSGVEVTFPVFTATDLSGAPVPTVEAVPASGSVFPIGTTTVTVTATDHVGLETFGTFDVIVTGQPAIGVQETGGPEIADGGPLAAFDPTALGSSSAAKTITIRNDGAAPLGLGAIALDGDHPGDFSNTNPAETELSPGESTTFTVNFNPATAVGSRSAMLHIASNDPDISEAVFDISLSGLAIAEPIASTGAATGLNYAGATLNGGVTANFADTTVTFEYGTTTAYGQSISATPVTVTGGSSTAVSASLQGLLEPETLYHFRLRAENTVGVSVGEDATFTTPPLVPGDLDLAFNPEINDLVFSTVVQPDGKILIGGYFTEVNGVERNRIARLNSNGTLDTTFNPPGGVNDGEEFGSVLSIAVQKDGKILIGGDFQTVNGEARTNLARLNPDGTRDTGWSRTVNGAVNSIVIDTLDRIHVGGFFSTASTHGLQTYFQDGNILRNYLLKFDTEPATVDGLAVDNEGRLLVAGNINTIGAFALGGQGLIRISTSGSVETTSFQPDILGAQQISVRPDGKLIVTGFFTEVNGVPKEWIVRLNDNGSLDNSFIPPDLESNSFSLATQVDSKTLSAGGSNAVFNSAIGRLLAADGAEDPTFEAGSDILDLYSVTQQPDGSILIGGGFTSVDGIPRTNLARLVNGPATESLSIAGPSRVEWLRDGNAPEVHTVIFEKSLNGGTTWTLHGLGVRIPGGWENTNSLGGAGLIRVTARTTGGWFSSSSGMIIQQTPFGAPSISEIADQITDEDTPTAPIAFTISDPESAAETLTVTGTSSDPSKVPNGGLVISGTGANRFVTINPQSNGFGNAQITLTVSDGVNTASTVFEITINPVNDAPFIFDVADQFANQGFSVGPISLDVGDPDPGLFSSLIVSAVSDNPVLLPLENIVIENALIPKRITLHPASGQSGTATITLTVTDGELTASTSFLLTVNGAPTISSITNQFIDEDTSTGPISFTINDPETPAESLTVTASSSNPTLVPNGNIVLAGTGANRTVTVTPAANLSGSATITVTVSEGSFFNISTVFVVTVSAINDAPTVGTIQDVVIFSDQVSGPTQFSIGDVDSDVLALAVTASSDNPTLVPPSGVVIQNVEGFPGFPFPGLKTITVTPAPGQSGAATITVTVSDGQASTATTFLLTVVPTLEIAVEQPEGDEIASGGTVDFGSVDTGANEDLPFTIRNLGLTQTLNLTGDPRVKVIGADFTITPEPEPSATIAPGGSTTFTVRFAPTSVGPKSAQLEIANNDSNEGTYVINLTGTGTSPVPPSFSSPPTIIPATVTEPALFSATVNGPPGAVIKLEASSDLGQTDAWEVIGDPITLDGNGAGEFENVPDSGSIGSPSNFYRLQME